jgi:predicted Ser/Thr protein kinase
MTSTSWSRKTTRSRWERLEELFNRAVDLPEDAREKFIVDETGDDAELREELTGLLACDTGKRTGPLTHALGEALDSTTRDKRRAHLGKVVGNYRLASVLGHGGTGTVYLGERADSQYSAQVAVKIVESAAVHGDLATRFRAERQILASLNHPNIARLMDAGESEDGQPYLVMEYIQGEPLDKYCDDRKLDVQARLRLFLEICGAVQYAHQNLVVHRDLKPANILVTTDGVAKLLDFGIAKLLDPGSGSSALALTRMNDRLLTPEYASPEQILGKPVTTTSDVYALGVVLYELLTAPFRRGSHCQSAGAGALDLCNRSAAAEQHRRASSDGSANGRSSEPGAHRTGTRRNPRALAPATGRRQRFDHHAGAAQGAAAPLRVSRPIDGRHPALLGQRAGTGAPRQLDLLLEAFRAPQCIGRIGGSAVPDTDDDVRRLDVAADPRNRGTTRPGQD